MRLATEAIEDEGAKWSRKGLRKRMDGLRAGWRIDSINVMH